MVRIGKGWLVVIVLSFAAAVAGAQEFRIETEVYRAAETQPVSESLTLFTPHAVYDFLLSQDKNQFAQEIAIFDFSRRRFVLLDVSRKRKTVIEEKQLDTLLSAMQADGMLPDRQLIDPKFEQDFDPATGWLTLSSDAVTYRVRGDTACDEIAFRSYIEYANQFARLNATDPRRMPPFARLKMNEAVRKMKMVPSEVEITLRPGGVIQRAIEIRARHYVIWQLSTQDRLRIEHAERDLAAFAEVNLATFRQLPESKGAGEDP